MTQAFAMCEARTCPCGCGQWTDDCLNPANENRYQVTAEQCHARAALVGYAHDNEKPPPGQLLSVQLLVGDEIAALEFDPDQALAQYEAHHARFTSR